MKTLILTVALIIAGVVSNAQTVVTIVADSVKGKDSEVASINYAVNNNYANEKIHYVYAWTQSGIPTIIRTFLWIDLSQIPTNATISSAVLQLYHDPVFAAVPVAGDNAFWVERVTQAWAENTITWNNQPTSTTTNRNASPTFSSTDNVFAINVGDVVKDIFTSGVNNGMVLKLKTEQYYRNVVFGSTENPDPSKRPSLTVTYTVPSTGTETVAETPFAVYPNPAQNTVTITGAEGNASIRILDAIGREVLHNADYGFNTPISIESLAPGIYYLQVNNGKTIKLVKQ
jgi:hypothetical protein